MSNEPPLPPSIPPVPPVIVPPMISSPAAPAIITPVPAAPAAAAPPAPAANPPRRSTLRTLLKVFAVVALVGFLCIGSGVGFIWYKMTRPSFGPPGTEDLELTLAPNVHVEVLPSSYKMADQKFSDFDITPDGAVIVLHYGRLSDLADGSTLGPQKPEAYVRTFAFVDGGLAVTLDSSRSGLAYLQGEEFEAVDLGDPHANAVFASQARDRLFIVDGHQLYSLASGGQLQPECASPADITAVTGDDVSCLFATHGGIFRMITPGEPLMLLKLPDLDDVLGLASTGETLYFSNAHAVYVVKGDLAVPLVLGLGGKLILRPDGLYVLDHDRGRAFRIVVGEAPVAK